MPRRVEITIKFQGAVSEEKRKTRYRETGREK
jgi:hypothetical protein